MCLTPSGPSATFGWMVEALPLPVFPDVHHGALARALIGPSGAKGPEPHGRDVHMRDRHNVASENHRRISPFKMHPHHSRERNA